MKRKFPHPIGVQKLQTYIKLGLASALETVIRERVPVLAYCKDLGRELPLYPGVVKIAILEKSLSIKAVFKLPPEIAALAETEEFFPELPPGELLMLDDGDLEEKHLYFYPKSQRLIEMDWTRDREVALANSL